MTIEALRQENDQLRELACEQWHALTLMLSSHYDDTASSQEERDGQKQAAYWLAMAAVKTYAKRFLSGTGRPAISKLASLTAAREATLDIRQELAAEQSTIQVAMTKGFDRLLAWPTLTDDQQLAAGHRFLYLARRLVDLAFWSGRPLPTTAVCVCPRPSCQKIVWPSFPDGGGYRCDCGVMWSSSPVSRPHPQVLPENMWVKYRPGMRYGGRLEIVDLKGRPPRPGQGDPYSSAIGDDVTEVA